MKCADALALMNSVIDNEATPEQEQVLRFHLNGCPECRKAMLVNRGLSEAMAGLGEPDPPGNLLESVMARLDSGTYDRSPMAGPARGFSRRWKIAAVLPFAAAALFFFSSHSSGNGSSPLSDQPATASEQASPSDQYAPAPVMAYSRPSSVTTF